MRKQPPHPAFFLRLRQGGARLKSRFHPETESQAPNRRPPHASRPHSARIRALALRAGVSRPSWEGGFWETGWPALRPAPGLAFMSFRLLGQSMKNA